jgi:NADH dehydrogenase/NADH:ubiquinone oxidoreductase subunit G
VAKKRNPTKIAVEEFLESQTIQPSFDPARFRMGEEKDRPTTRDYDAEAAAAAREAEEALLEAERQARVAGEGEKLAKVQEDLAATEAAKLAAEEAARKAKADADAAAAAAAKKAAEEAARLQAALDAANKAAADAANKSVAEKAAAELAARNAAAALAAANAANAASGNINVGNNVFIPATPAAGGMGASDILAKQYAEAQAQREKDETMQRQSITDTLTDRFTRYKLTGLIPTIKRLAQEGATESTITFALQDTEDYKKRFRANEERLKKGLQVLDPGTYLKVEDGYRQTLRAYGLNQFDTDDYVSQFIANDMSPGELSNRVATAVQRVRNADPAVSNMLKNYYGIGQNDLVAYVLDPNQQFQKIERQVAAAEIGVAGGRQGLNVGVPVAEQFAAQGITQAQAQRGYSTIANILPTAEKLSNIYGTTLDKYGQVEGEQEMFNELASAQRKRQRLIGREVAEFTGQSGITRGSLGTSTGGQY